ncbi:hypothetical protein GLOIN_2v1764530 [Rhizophagus irregularis DAOM 181602=DAOM 197198]|uniref:Uncharacterized protein n=1 Tax=Rhizophagus irregularis (strain DAOM 181602 / DAOM 197198 / MUCL 43194) TaxID=747089 RepID=A0A2P4QRZ8_RHIID|nr:hypothetical protein GLOIN_2v1764530 [Rhizophagus irregularis DAOM 181602=DAOM 197198]PKY32156.1 hypothetical protein RhiirB3_450150 [Rhizophagus irregularis]POG80410.1 hypothetical protein GLOIN_2v1764530 [Rhizophagus irregularis DAOM 181602=DAOM 197198]GET50223.1 hypothetical protein GLOIN_2v1764530 [Rhizophagus irregularis DAOM 181602=DAOM 197198]CAG8705176.1 11693_t:CDS:2 [Rhizophagus irregularis]|eukprot:XP_025187276.1 hypothetical protein GLOIN_2v1764530 [Rhizophagus irregularis DAOM 181602=DAOM 197198]
MSKNRKVYWKCKKQVIQQLPKVPLENAVFKDLIEDDLKPGTRKAEILIKRCVRRLANNKSKSNIYCKEVYIKSSDLTRLYSDVSNRQHFNNLNDEIILNYTYNEEDFTMIKNFKEKQLPAVRILTDEDYR